MSKKSLDRKVAQKIIVDSRDSGKTDQEIYNELVATVLTTRNP
jgi:hypothetical protein